MYSKSGGCNPESDLGPKVGGPSQRWIQWCWRLMVYHDPSWLEALDWIDDESTGWMLEVYGRRLKD